MPKDRQRIAKKLQLVSLESNQIVFEANTAIQEVFFPLSAAFSVSETTSEGHVVEINQIGCEGIAGVEVALRTPYCGCPIASTIAQIPGTALRMSAEHFAEEVDQHPTVNRWVRLYMSFFFVQLQVFVACNRHHALEQRCARRLLIAQDLSGGSQTLNITQNQLAQMLGVSRQSIDRTLHVFEEQTILHLSRRIVRIEDRQLLKAMSCQCYRLLKRELAVFMSRP